jgi:predicted nucleic acid-binding protein
VIFVDTSFFFALFFRKEPNHARVREVFETLARRSLPDELLTTNHVLFETLTLTRSAISHEAAVYAAERLYSERIARIHWATPEEEAAAVDFFKRHRDKEYSAVDCLSFVVMEKCGIQKAWTLDSDFSHRFTAVPGPLSRGR